MKLRLDSPLLYSVVLSVALGLATACTTVEPQEIDYAHPVKPSDSPLVRPPDIAGEADNVHQSQSDTDARLSAYQRQPHNIEPIKDVLKPIPGISIQRDGTAHWLVVQHKTPAQLWPLLRQFWQEQGFSLVVDKPERAFMETAWKQTRAPIKLGIIRQTLSKNLGSIYVSAEKNKYRTRLEVGANGATYIFISQLGMHEVSDGLTKQWTRWEATPNNPTLEIEYLQRLMYALAPDERKATKQAAAAGSVEPQNAQPVPAVKNKPVQQEPTRASGKETLSAQVTQFELAQSFDRAWLRVGLALERGNFTVDDRDRERGLYYVRYVDPNDRHAGQQGFWYQVFHGKKEIIAKQYKLNVRALTETVTRVAIVNESNEIDTSPQARWIVSRLAEQLRPDAAE